MKKYPNAYIQTVERQFVNYAGEEVTSQISFNPDPDGNEKLDGKVEFAYNGKTIKANLPISVKNVADLLGIQKKAPEPAPEAEQNQPAQKNEQDNPNAPAQQPPAAPTDTIPPITEPADSTNVASAPTDTIPPIKEPADSTNVASAPTNKSGAPTETTEETTSTEETQTLPKNQKSEGTEQTQLPEGATEVAGKDADGKDCHIVKDKDGRELKRIYDKGEANEYSVTVEYDNNGKKTKEIETHCGNTKTDIIRYYKPNGKLEKIENYNDDGTTLETTVDYKYNEDGSYTKTEKHGDGKTFTIHQHDKNGNPLKTTYYKDDSTTIDHTAEYKYNEAGSYTTTIKDGDGITSSIAQYDKNNNLLKTTYYKNDGKTPNEIIENGIVRLQHIKNKDADGKVVEHKYEFDENGVCIKSSLAQELYNQINPASLNSKTIKKLKQLNSQNIIKVLTAYQKLAGKTLQQAIADEWGSDIDVMKKLVSDALNARLKKLGLDPAKVNINDPKQLAEIAKLDNKKS